jgi:hypothetical protein
MLGRVVVAWIYSVDSKSGRAIDVALNGTAEVVQCKQMEWHYNWVFVHTELAKRSDGTTTATVRKT